MYKRCLMFLALVFAASVAHADTTTYLVTVTSDSGFDGSLDATYQLTFDPTQTYSDQASGISVVSASGYYQPTQLLFSYDPTTEDGLLSIGAEIAVDQLDDNFDFHFSVGSLTTASPVFHDAVLANGPVPADVTTYGSVTQVASTPEPSSLWMLGTGLLGGIPVLRRRLAV